MCGIFGFTGSTPNASELLEGMAQVQIHRGPDGYGHFVDPNIAMGMRRLSIIDIENGWQPFYSDDKNIIVFQNGEVYNYIELKKDLESEGVKFHTSSDVEVIPHLYKKYGINFLSKLNGMFAISIYDKSTESLYLVRDRIGIKPLYYSHSQERLSYSSELKSLLALPWISKDLNEEALQIYLDLMFIPSPMSPFIKINKLEPGHYLKFHRGSLSQHDYWNLNSQKVNDLRTQEDFQEELDFLLKDSLKLRMRADVPVGCFLSGGVDSACIVSYASEMANENFNTYHILWEGSSQKVDESPRAKALSEHYQTQHIQKKVFDKDLFFRLPELIYHLDEPFADGAFINTFGLSNKAAEDVKVILSGAGGDELFGGYNHYRETKLWKHLIAKCFLSKDLKNSYYDKYRCHNRIPLFENVNIHNFRTSYDNVFRKKLKSGELRALMLSDIRHYLQDDILFLTDKMTMATSLECRVPMLDHRIVELSAKIPTKYKILQGQKKQILKNLMRNKVPLGYFDQKKEGFGLPVHHSMNQYKSHYDQILKKGYLINKSISFKNTITSLVKTPKLSPNKSWVYWKLLILDIWFQEFVIGKKPEAII